LSRYLDTNVLARFLVGDSPEQALRAREFLRGTDSFLTDTIFAEVVFLLQSFYKVPRPVIGELMRSVLALPTISCDSVERLHRALEVFEVHRLDFAEAYLIAVAEAEPGSSVVSFDRAIARVRTIVWIEP
jgi:predicted nucleic acid-binding protein